MNPYIGDPCEDCGQHIRTELGGPKCAVCIMEVDDA